jgi:hypothetical protein
MLRPSMQTIVVNIHVVDHFDDPLFHIPSERTKNIRVIESTTTGLSV